MFQEGDRVYIKEDIGVLGVEVGTQATIQHIAKDDYFYPIHLKLDVPCNDEHSFYRVAYKDIAPLPEDMINEPLFVVEPDWSGIEEGDVLSLF